MFVTKMKIAAALMLLSAGASDLGVAANASVCDRQMVMQIDSAKISVEPDGFVIDAFGVAESLGWKNPTLILAGRTGDTAAVDFVACRPEVSAQVLTPIQTRTTLDLGPSTRQIIIRAKTNTMTVEITRP
jgi:hypothetical protein